MAKSKEIKFEDKMKNLQDIVEKLEKDNIDLDASLDLYKQGLELSKDLKEELEKFEKKIKEINKN